MAVNLSPVGGVAGQFFDNNGDPLVGGKLFTYAAGTTTPQVTYTSSSGATPNSNPIILNAGGRVPSEIWLTDGLAYKFVLYSSTDQLIGSWDNINGINSNFVNFVTSEEVQTATAGQTVFTLTTMQYQPGTNNLVVYVDGVNQVEGGTYSFVETDSTTVTFTAGLHLGAVVKFVSAETVTTIGSNAAVIAYEPAGAGAVTTTVQAKLRETVSVKDFGAVGDGVTDDTAAIEAAWAASKDLYFPPGTYLTSGLRINGGSAYGVKRIQGGNATITGDDFFFIGLFDLSMSDITFSATGTINIEGLRYCNWARIVMNGFVQWGKFGTTGLSSWSTYWSSFTQCKFRGGIHFNSALINANINSNTFDTCEFRGGSQTAIMKFTKTPDEQMAFSSNTFIGCDFSYTPVLNIVDTPTFWAATIVGGYFDSGTPLYLAGSLRARELEMLHIRNPGSAFLDITPAPYSANIRTTSGGARPKKQIPVGAVNLFPSVPTAFVGTFARDVTSIPVPYDGDYTVSLLLDDLSGTGFDAIRCDNVTVGTQILGGLKSDGYSSFTFSASKSDVIRVRFDGNVGTNATVIGLSLTPGAGVMNTVPYRTVFPTDDTVTNCPAGVATTLVTRTAPTFSLQFFKIIVYTKNPVAAGGGEKIEYTLAVTSGGSAIATTLTTVSRTSVNGVGGISGRSGTFDLSVVASGLSYNLVGAMTSADIVSVDATVKIYGANQD